MYLFTSEVVSSCHPDKCADIVADNSVAYGSNIDEINDDILSQFVMDNFSLTPNWITKKFSLIYPWEKFDELEKFKRLKN